MLISIVIPCHNEADNIELVHTEVVELLSNFDFETEFIFVDDGSIDSTWERISNLGLRFSSVRGIQLSRNFGHATALEAGLSSSKGDAIIMMDADLQHPPSLIPEMVDAWKSGYKIVNTIRQSTVGTSKIKSITSKNFYKFLNSLSDINIKSGEADFRLVDRAALDVVLGMPESPKFFRGLFNWIGFNKYEIKYVAPKRVHGKSSFSLPKMYELARVGLTSFSKKPLVAIFFFGLLLSLFSTFTLISMTIVKWLINPIFFSNLSFLVVFVLLIAGMILTSQGILATYVIDIYDSAKSRPSYLVKQAVNLEGHESKK